MTPEVLERFLNGKFPERHELTNMDLFVMMQAHDDKTLAIQLIETLYKTGMARMKVDPEFRKRAEEMTLQLQKEKAEHDVQKRAESQNR
jgi:hypothetical protein